MKIIDTDVFILGAGAGGFGACYKLTEMGISVVIADKNSGFGGTAVFSGVSCFEPGVSLEGVHLKLAERLLSKNAAQVQKTVPAYRLFRENPTLCLPGEDVNKYPYGVTEEYPWGLSVDSGDPYSSTLKRCRKFCSSPFDWRRFMTDEEELTLVMSELVSENKGNFTPLFGFEFKGIEISGEKITSVTVSNKKEDIKIKAKNFIDSSGSIVLARSAGCKYERVDSQELNGVSLVLRVSKTKKPLILPKYDLSGDEEWKQALKYRISCFNMYPDGDININMLPTLSGKEYIQFGDNSYSIALNRMLAYFEYLQKEKGLSDYAVYKVFPMLGVREDYHLIGKKVLTHEDILKGIDPRENYIAIADHALDMHGVEGGVSGELKEPYGIPLETAQTREYSNLFVACRGASFSHVAASSARLTRMIMSMGEGVATHIAELI